MRYFNLRTKYEGDINKKNLFLQPIFLISHIC